jgi:hypothetical protein
MDSLALSLSPNRSIQTITLDSDRYGCPQLHQQHQQLHQHQLQNLHQRLERPQDAFRALYESSQESLARIDLSPKRVSMTEADMAADASAVSAAMSAAQAPITSKSTRNRKTVRFSGSDDSNDDSDNNSCHANGTVVPMESVDIDKSNGDQLYWTEVQLLQFQRQAKQVALEYRQNKPYVAAVKRMIQSHRNVGASDANADAAADVVQVLVESAARGLESRIVPLLKLHRKRTIRAVLELQASLKGEHDEHTDDSKNAETVRQLLRRKSMQASRPWRHLARQLAVGDAAAAHIDGPSMPMSSSKSMTAPTPSVWLQQEQLQQQQQHSAIVEA